MSVTVSFLPSTDSKQTNKQTNTCVNMNAGTERDQQMVLDLLELESQLVVSNLMWVLELNWGPLEE